jgi:hypothetical protein
MRPFEQRGVSNSPGGRRLEPRDLPYDGHAMTAFNDTTLKSLLADRPKAELVSWIVEQAVSNEPLRLALLAFVTPVADSEGVAKELSKVIRRAWALTNTSRESWKLAKPIASELEPVLAALDRMIELGSAAAAEKVLRLFIEAFEKGIGEVDDSYADLSPLCREAVTLWGKAWTKITPRDPAKLAALVYEGVCDNGYGLRDHMIRDFDLALGREGLVVLKSMFLAQHEANAAKTDLDEWTRREPWQHLADVADAMGDVDMYIEVQRTSGMDVVYAMPIARRLFDAGRAAEALISLDRADPERGYFQGEKDSFITLRTKILRALGRDDEAHAVLWQAFCRGLDHASLDQVLAMTPEERRSSLMEDAFKKAESHPNRLTAAIFLAERSETARAAKLVEAHPQAFDGQFYSSLLRLAELLRVPYPAAAWELYWALLQNILEKKRSKAYHHAAEYLAIAGELAERANLTTRHGELLAILRNEHKRKHAFWGRVQE